MCDFDGEYGAAPDVNENFGINDGGERIIDAAADSEIEILDVDTVSEDWGDDTAILDISDESVDVAPNEDAVSEAFFDSFSLDELDDSHYRASSLSKEEVQQIDDLWKEDSKSTDVEPYQAERMSEDGVAKIEEFSKDEALDTEPYHAISNNLDVAAESDADHVSDEIKALSLDEIEARQEHLVKLESNADADIFKEYDANVNGSLTEEQYHDLVDGLPKEALEHLRDGLENRDKDVLDYFGLSSDDGNSDHPKELVLKRM